VKGKVKIINSRKDAQCAGLSDQDIIKMATVKVTYDAAIYPPEYDANAVKAGGQGYIPPVYRTANEVVVAVLNKFGVKA
jgi:hypothetical protein